MPGGGQAVCCVLQFDVNKMAWMQVDADSMRISLRSSGYPTLRPQPESTKKLELPKGPYGTANSMMNGFNASRVSAGIRSHHPLQSSEEQWQDHQMKLDYVMLKNSQGIHAPLRLQMEKHVASQMQRLPCLPSSNLMMDTLTGRDDLIGFEDFLNNPADSEVMGQPHAMMERRLNLI